MVKTIPEKTKYALSFRLKTSKTKARKQYQGQIKEKAKVWQSEFHPFKLSHNTYIHARAWLPTLTGNLKTQALQEQQGLNYGAHFTTLFGRHSIIFDVYGTLTAECLEKTRKEVSKMAKKGCFWLRLCCQIPITIRPSETRMGKGKGAISHWEARPRPGQTWYEFAGLSHKRVNHIFQSLRQKSPVRIRLVGLKP
jgi:large subunit ribosomal protein L16